jgi:hypothetical protein
MALTGALPFLAEAQPGTAQSFGGAALPRSSSLVPFASLGNSAATAKPFVRPFPFKTIRVLDNQAGTILNSPPAIALDRPAAEAIQGYLDTVTRLSPKGDKNLLLNIREMVFVKIHSDSYLSLKADVYYSTGNEAWHPFLNIALEEARWQSTPKNNYGVLLDRLIALLSEIPDPSAPPAPLPRRIRRMVKNKQLHLLEQIPSLTIEQIDVPARTRWVKDYPALSSLGKENGVYSDFYAFRNGEIEHDMIDLQFDTTDSTYHVGSKGQGWKGTLPYVIARDGELFKLLPNDSYVRLIQDSATFQFSVPHSLPDMESLSKVRRLQDAKDPSGSSHENPLVGLVVGLTYSAVATSIRGGEIKHAQKTGLTKDEYRNCMINMDTGYVIYR